MAAKAMQMPKESEITRSGSKSRSPRHTGTMWKPLVTGVWRALDGFKSGVGTDTAWIPRRTELSLLEHTCTRA